MTDPTLPAPAPPGPGAVRPFHTTPGIGPWWVIAGLVLLLLVGSALGYGGTRVALALATEGDPSSATDQPAPGGAGPAEGAESTPGPGGSPSQPPEPGGSPGPPAPPIPSITPPPGGSGGELCGEVALVMVRMVAVAGDPGQSPETVVEAWRTAAEELRSLADQTPDEPERVSLERLADEFDTSVQAVEDDPGDQRRFEVAFSRLSDAYQTFNDQTC
jgi:hypothetical protein